jgi:hypothetical protein
MQKSKITLALALAASFLCVGSLIHAQESSRNYHRYTIAQIAAENPADWKHPLTHIEIDGWVTYIKKEGDGDTHIRVCDSAPLHPANQPMNAQHCIVAECIPELPCAAPRKGQHVLIDGIGRYDAENPGHHWWECHPVEKLRVIPQS